MDPITRDLSMDSCQLNQHLAKAVDLFVMTKFHDCFEGCKRVINAAKMEAEQERNDVIIEAATALGIQALAEVDCWMETPAFITDVYGSVDLCPARIIQVCILLHAHVREYLPCHSMVQAWLKNPQNLTLKQCGQVVRIYSAHVLCPTGSHDMVKEIVDKCIALTQDEKSTLLQQSLLQTMAQSELRGLSTEELRLEASLMPARDALTSEDNTRPSSTSHNNSSAEQQAPSSLHPHELFQPLSATKTTTAASPLRDSQEEENTDTDGSGGMSDPLLWIQETALEGFSRLCHFVAGKFKILHNPGVQLFLMGLVAVLALMQTQTGDVVSSLGRFIVLWRGFLQKLFDYLKVP